MKKNYPERLEQWVRQRASSTREKNRVAFLAVRDDVREAMSQKFPVKTIWENLHEEGLIAFGYDAFLNYVHRFGLHAELGQPAAEGSKDQNSENKMMPRAGEPQAGQAPAADKHLTPAGFVFNPIPNKEELL